MSFLRKRVLVAMSTGIAVLAVPALALAQSNGDEPPSPPIAVVYGEADGASVGQAVVAFVQDGNASTNCGVGEVTRDDEDDIAYVVDIESAGSIEGCAEDGDTVGLWFLPEGGEYGASGDTTIEVSSSAGGIEQDVSLEERTNRLHAPQLASNAE